jgi:excisionase family DNA binding protein
MILEGRLSITEVAKKLGVSTKTITRWEKAGKIKQAKRDWRGWRAYTAEELEEMKSFVQTVY